MFCIYRGAEAPSIAYTASAMPLPEEDSHIVLNGDEKGLTVVEPITRLSYGCLVTPPSQTKRAKTALEAHSWLDKRFKIFRSPDGVMMALSVSETCSLGEDETLQDILLNHGGRFEPDLLPPALHPSPPEAPLPSSPGTVRVVELFAGIGGFRVGCDTAVTGKQFRVVFASEIDKWARLTYKANFSPQHGLTADSDITITPSANLPPHDLLTGGFPCQPFSGMGKRLGTGEAKGRLFLHIVRLAKAHQPKVLLLENVAGLLSIGGGNTIKHIVAALAEIGYAVTYKV